MEKVEYERKYKLKELPSSRLLRKEILIFQAYIFTEPYELRIRRYNEEYILTMKDDKIENRLEWEVTIPKWVFNGLLQHIDGREIEKIRYSIPYNDLILEIDEFKRRLKGLIILECEFPNEEAYNKFKLPKWISFEKELTGDKAYLNKNLALYGIPPCNNSG